MFNISFLILIFLLCPLMSANAFLLPDTGQTACYNGTGNVIGCPVPTELVYQLTVTVDGRGIVASSPSGLNCALPLCGGLFPVNTDVALLPIPIIVPVSIPFVYGIFGSWSGDCSPGGQVHMDTNKSCTATFSSCGSMFPARRYTFAPPYILEYGSVNEAYTASGPFETISLLGRNDYIPEVSFSENKIITLLGGYSCDWMGRPDSAYTFWSYGVVIISNGTITLDKIVIM